MSKHDQAGGVVGSDQLTLQRGILDFYFQYGAQAGLHHAFIKNFGAAAFILISSIASCVSRLSISFSQDSTSCNSSAAFSNSSPRAIASCCGHAGVPIGYGVVHGGAEVNEFMLKERLINFFTSWVLPLP